MLINRFIILASLCFFACKQAKKHEKNNSEFPVNTTGATNLKTNYLDEYHFQVPDEIIKLPKELNEISGLCIINDSIIAAICDSRPNLYIVNISTRKITGKIMVAHQGDFEDVTLCGDTAFVLQSNGVLWKVAGFSGTPAITSDTLQLEQPFELEGLYHNITNDSLYIAAKYWHKNAEGHDLPLPVFAYSIKNKKLAHEPLFSIPVTTGSEKAKHPFHTSGILQLLHPVHWIAISTNNKFIAQLNQAGVKDTVESLNEEIFIQPEGICIDKHGTIYITNEGKSEKDKPTLLKFTRKL